MQSEVLNQYFLFLSGTLSLPVCARLTQFPSLEPCHFHGILTTVAPVRLPQLWYLFVLPYSYYVTWSLPKIGRVWPLSLGSAVMDIDSGSVGGKQGYPSLLMLTLVVLGRRKG